MNPSNYEVESRDKKQLIFTMGACLPSQFQAVYFGKRGLSISTKNLEIFFKSFFSVKRSHEAGLRRSSKSIDTGRMF